MCLQHQLTLCLCSNGNATPINGNLVNGNVTPDAMERGIHVNGFNGAMNGNGSLNGVKKSAMV